MFISFSQVLETESRGNGSRPDANPGFWIGRLFPFEGAIYPASSATRAAKSESHCCCHPDDRYHCPVDLFIVDDTKHPPPKPSKSATNPVYQLSLPRALIT